MIKSTLASIFRYLKRAAWKAIVIYMVGLHNFYKQDDKTADDIVITINVEDEQEDSSPKD